MSNLSLHWYHTVFYRSDTQKQVWVLAGFPSQSLNTVLARLFALKCEYVSAGCTLASSPWVAFKTKKEVSAALALLFKAPKGKAPLIVRTNKNGEKMVLSGIVETEARLTLKVNKSAADKRGWEVQKGSNAVEVEVLTTDEAERQEAVAEVETAVVTGLLTTDRKALPEAA